MQEAQCIAASVTTGAEPSAFYRRPIQNRLQKIYPYDMLVVNENYEEGNRWPE
jgi:hypothetical protein